MDALKTIISASLLSLSTAVLAVETDSVRLIIKYKNTPSTLMSMHSQLKKIVALPIKELSPMAGGAYTLTLDNRSTKLNNASVIDPTEEILSKLRKNPNILYAVKDRIGHFKPLPKLVNENTHLPRLSHDAQWNEFTRPGGVMLESAPNLRDGAWAHTTGLATPPVVVAVLDTGIAEHEGLMTNLLKDESGNIWGWNFADNDRNLNDETGSFHGTHVAGIIAGFGPVMMGMGEHLKILPLKIPGKGGLFYESSVINAIYWSVGGNVPGAPQNPYPASVLNMSFGVDEKPGKEIDHCDEPLQEAISFARDHNAVIVTAAGNDNHWEHYNAPAVCNGTLKIASTGPQGLRAYYSNYGPAIAFAAPGGDKRSGIEGAILSTVNPGAGYDGSGYDFYQGTSMAAPHVAGVAGLVFAAGGKSIPAEYVEKILYISTHNFGLTDRADESCIDAKPCGHGILDAENAVKTSLASFDVLFTAPKGPDIKTDDNWVFVQTIESAKSNHTLPYVKKEKDGRIHAIVGNSQYRLNPNLYQTCEIVGFDGVGCYK